MSVVDESLPTDPKRVRAFATFFKNYMSVSSLVVAALPIPATAFGALPTFIDYRASLSTYTSLFCFLTLGFIFYMRHGLARWMFPLAGPAAFDMDRAAVEASDASAAERVREERALDQRQRRRAQTSRLRSVYVGMLPLLLLLTSGVLVFAYHRYLDEAILEIARSAATPNSAAGPACATLDGIRLVNECRTPTRSGILSQSYLAVPYGTFLMALYICMFVTAEASFILMATREYIQDLLRLTDWEVIRGVRVLSSAATASSGDTIPPQPKIS
jgi:hypothetical protein